MARFTITRPHSMSIEAVRASAEALAEELAADYGLRARWDGDRVSLRGSGVEGSMDIGESELVLKVKLGLLASALERPLKQAMNNSLDEHVN